MRWWVGCAEPVGGRRATTFVAPPSAWRRASSRYTQPRGVQECKRTERCRWWRQTRAAWLECVLGRGVADATRATPQRVASGSAVVAALAAAAVVALNVAVTMNRESASLDDTRNPPSFLSSTSVLVAAAANDAASRPWGYGPENGPAAWSALSPTFQLCQDGKMQSPVALSERDSIAMRYSPDSPPFELRTNEALWRLRPRSAADAEHATLVFEEFIPPPPPIVGDVPPVSGFAEPPPAALLTLHELPAEPPPPPPAGAEDNAATTTTTSEMSPIIKLSDSQALTYRLTSLHFHAPQSEHVLERVRGDLEMHAVFHNVADAKDVAVISRIWRAPPPSPPTVDEAIPGGAPATPMASVEESPPVPAWIEALLTLAENSSGNAASDTEAPAAVQVASTAPVAVADHTAAARIHEVSLRAAQVAQFNFADALVRSSPFRQPVVTTPVGGIESSMTLPTEESDQEVLPNFFFYRGSLSSPPCSENAKWIVLMQRDPMSRQAVERIVALQGGVANVRPLQERNGRRVLAYRPDTSPPPLGSTVSNSNNNDK
ncbi:hypothetical protein CDCA_CDCA02G0644 [Cyanidium caldarium]|uniref:carbonic anhydrase n=1 Tax=Cyanidium caldarium TaxID=2771 RepID=A0AAV9IR46_CYACA|nr:hypothetical protein CDCA_CDCA02G0644 [Cyanidium caldarium]